MKKKAIKVLEQIAPPRTSEEAEVWFQKFGKAAPGWQCVKGTWFILNPEWETAPYEQDWVNADGSRVTPSVMPGQRFKLGADGRYVAVYQYVRNLP